MEKHIIDVINDSDKGYISFHQFMEMALYHPYDGYYHNESIKIGAQGDFYTSSNIGDAFGRALGKWFIYLFSSSNLPKCIVEIGAGTGKIARGILSAIQEQSEAIFSELTYFIIDSSTYHQKMQKKHLAEFDCISYFSSLEQLDELNGIVFSNELFDAFPVHVIEQKQGKLYEVMVAVENNKLVEKFVPLHNEYIYQYIEKQSLHLQENQRIEIPLAMLSYFQTLSKKIHKGLLITIDYGYTTEEWHDPIHQKGSIRGYYQHQMISNVLEKPGLMDITTHIHWDALRYGDYGLENAVFYGQTEFLLACGILEDLQNTFSSDPFSEQHKRNRAIRSLIQPGQISSHFKVLIQSKQLDCSKKWLFDENYQKYVKKSSSP